MLKVNGDRNITHNQIKAKIGFTNKQNHNVFYIEGGIFIKPINTNDNFIDLMNQIENRCRKYIKNTLRNSTFLTNDFLMKFDVCSQRMQQNKKSYLSFQYHFKQQNNENKSIIHLKEEKEDFFNNILKNIEEELQSEDFLIFSNKNKDEVI